METGCELAVDWLTGKEAACDWSRRHTRHQAALLSRFRRVKDEEVKRWIIKVRGEDHRQRIKRTVQ